MGSPARGHGSNCRLRGKSVKRGVGWDEGGNLQGVLQVLIDLHYCSLVAASVAVVGGYQILSKLRKSLHCRLELTREDGHYIPVLGPVVTLHHQLMGTSDEGQAIIMVESL